MAASPTEGPLADMPTRPTRPLNLTAATEKMSWELARKVVGVAGPSATAAFDIRGICAAESACASDGRHEAVYMVISGYGVLLCADAQVQCTAGDVLFVPAGCPHHFERLDGDIRIWRISPFLP